MFTLSFFGDNCREALTLCGKVSGKDRDKIKEAGLTPYYVDGTTAFEEAELVFVCRKLYADEIRSEKFIDKDADENCYPSAANCMQMRFVLRNSSTKMQMRIAIRRKITIQCILRRSQRCL